MVNKYAGRCRKCGAEVSPGKGVCKKYGRRWMVFCKWGECQVAWAGMSQAESDRQQDDAEMRVARAERANDDAEYAKGVASVDRYRDNARFFGEDYAAAEELAWELRDPDPAY